MYHIPGIDKLHALRDSLGVVLRAKLPIGRTVATARACFLSAPLLVAMLTRKVSTTRTQACATFMIFPEGKIGAYLDWRAQEVGVAAALSGDETLMQDYQAGDIYYALAKMCELTREPDFRIWKKQNPDTRQRMKSLQLGINYGMGVPSLARGLQHPLIASTIIEKHKRRYPQFRKWRAEQVDNAMTSRRMETVFGWPLHIKNSPNERTLFNFPMQGGGAEMLAPSCVAIV